MNNGSEPDMRLVDAMRQRRSVRGFLDRPVPPRILENILELASHAPSNCNVQPWKVFIATGGLRDQLRDKMLARAEAGVPGNPDFESTPKFTGVYRKRQVDCAVALYSRMGIGRDDKAGRRYALLRNFRFFDAPCIAFIGMEREFGTTVAVDVGMYAQNLMLAMVAHGLHSCPMANMREYPDLVREAFGIRDGTRILFGIAFGYEDPRVPANQTRTSRDPVSSNVVIKSKAE